MKILVVARCYPKSENNMLGLFERDQAFALKKSGHDVIYAVLDMRSIRQKRKLGYNRFDDNGIHVYEMNIPLGNLPIKLIACFEELSMKKLFSKIQAEYGVPDIVHAHFYKMAVGVQAFFNEKGIPVILTEHSSSVASGRLSTGDKKFIFDTYRKLDGIIAVSHPLASFIYEQSGVQPKVVPNMVDLKSVSLQKKRNERFRFVSAGNLIERKGFDLLISAMQRVIKVYPDTELIIYGDGPFRTNYEKMIKEYRLSHNIILYGRYVRDEIFEKYAEADAFVLASKGESFGVVYIEAMACGLPVIGTVCGGPEDFINNEVGILIPKENVEQLAIAMIEIIKNIESYDRQLISDYVSKNFSSEQVALRLLEVYQRTINKRKGMMN